MLPTGNNFYIPSIISRFLWSFFAHLILHAVKYLSFVFVGDSIDFGFTH